MTISQCKEAFCLICALCSCMLMLLSDCRLRLCMFDACAALYREVYLLFAWMLCSDGFTACTDSVRRACIAVCLLIPPHIFLHFLRFSVTASARFRADDGVPNALYCPLHCVCLALIIFQQRDVLLCLDCDGSCLFLTCA